MFNAEISGSVNWAPNNPKLVFTGEALTFMRLSPMINCHQGINSEITSTIKVIIPAANPNQLTFVFNLSPWRHHNPTGISYIVNVHLGSCNESIQVFEGDVDVVVLGTAVRFFEVVQCCLCPAS